MFKRSTLKQRAKETLSVGYWYILLIVLISGGITMLVSTIISLATGSGEILSNTPAGYALWGMMQLASLALSIAAASLVTLPLKVGTNKYLLEMCEKKTSSFDNIFYAFRTNYLGITAVSFAKTLIINLLLYIPIVALAVVFGIAFTFQSETLLYVLLPLCYVALISALVKAYDYYLVEYILSEKPNLSWREALKESKTLMKGNRFAAFKLNLSFFGWVFLGLLACGIGVLFVLPYMQTTDAELYRELTGKNNIETDFGGV